MKSVFRGAVLLASLLASLMTVSPAFAGGIDDLKAFVAQVHSAKGDFVQRQVNAPKAPASGVQGFRPSGTQSGNFVFARPGKFIWAYTKPYDQLLQADGENFYVYDKDLNQVTHRKLGNVLGASPAAILFGSNDIEKSFDLRDVGVKDGIDWLEMTPKSKDTQFQQVGIGFKDGMLAAMELHDVFGNVTLLTFTNVVKNPSLPAGTFKFTPPKGADVIDG
ncbi:outer membrane lipoprotein chaperone LolA [Pararobbsia alpina]|uniref:Outer-membrane lipoprotein carrier protein n=1 Tax=Pararobbsia alpina TaxID=621374 RepID=A0A6S7AUH7_9BURK|nr:outer membrane lipoprotein chaperone LolA [Pararobbsia alpina]CAB3776035.1 Outer-membrane lipoprotein carrier protein [Pararobbsia alpina]